MSECADGVHDAPMFFHLLDESDQARYTELRAQLRNSEKRYKRNKRIEGLQDALDAIQAFAVRSQPDDWKRSLVCGVCWLGPDIAINIRQLRLLVDKCKSSINGALSKMGYGAAPLKAPVALLAHIPFLKGNFVEQRQWTVRRRVHLSPAPARSPLPTPVFHTPTPGACASPDSPTPFPPGIDCGFLDTRPWCDRAPEQPDDATYNFITDPCCCCPINWSAQKDNIDDLFQFG
jgi:hypothetical protein